MFVIIYGIISCIHTSLIHYSVICSDINCAGAGFLLSLPSDVRRLTEIPYFPGIVMSKYRLMSIVLVYSFLGERTMELLAKGDNIESWLP